MRGVLCLALGWIGLTAAAGPPAGDEMSYVCARQVVLTFAAENSGGVDQVELWASRDGGQSWEPVPAVRMGGHALRYKAPADGAYAFYLVLKNAAGASAGPPTRGCRPHMRVLVDTTAPTLQLHPEASAGPIVAGSAYKIRASLIDEHLGAGGVRVFYRTSGGGPWVDGRQAAIGEHELVWRVPADVAGSIDLRVVATDLAGNRAVEETRGLSVAARAADPAQTPTASGSLSPPPQPDADTGPVAPVRPISAATVEPVTLDGASAPSQPETHPNRAGQEYLRRLATRFMLEQRYDLAAARLEDALATSPNDADLLVDLGSALYRSGRYDDADVRFNKALEARPDHTGALEGLALVAATQKRYPQARTHLQHLLRLMPESGRTWLHYGDIEHKLGNVDLALEAWERVLELDDAEDSSRQKAEKRLRYFGPARLQDRP